MAKLVIRPVNPTDQVKAKTLILDGLIEWWGTLDPTLNPDLDDIARHYADEIFLVAYQGADLVGTGALIKEDGRTGRVVRMSVAKSARRQGIGKQILNELIQHGTNRGYQRIVLETTATWTSTVAFYERYGFRTTHFANGDRHFVMELVS